MCYFLDFTDLIERLFLDFGGPPRAAAALFLDEVQDFSPLELGLARKWGQSMARLVLGGDDDQAIYTWRGATADAFLRPAIPAEQKRVLSQSYRLPRAVHRVTSRWIEQLSRREHKTYEPRNFEGEVSSTACLWTWKYPDLLVEELERSLSAGKTVAILASCASLSVIRRPARPPARPPCPNRRPRARASCRHRSIG